MSFAVIVLAAALLGAMAVFALQPIFEDRPGPGNRVGPGGTARQNQALETFWAEKQRVLRAIRDLDFDYDLGKLPDAAYQAQRVYLVRLAVAIMKRIDELEAEIADREARIEQAVAAFRQARSQETAQTD